MTFLSLALLAGVTSGSNAASLRVPLVGSDSPIVQGGEGCGANRWRDRNGNCHWFGGPGGPNRGTAAVPTGAAHRAVAAMLADPGVIGQA